MVRIATDCQLPQRASSATAYVALLALAVLQLGIALHHDQHAATDLTSTCVACVQLEQFDDLVPATGTEIVTQSEGSVAFAPVMLLPASAALRPYNSRAPPSAHS